MQRKKRGCVDCGFLHGTVQRERRKLLIKCQRVAVMVEIALRIRKSYFTSSHGASFSSSLKKAAAGVVFHSLQLMRL